MKSDQAAISVALTHSGIANDQNVFLSDSKGSVFTVGGGKLNKYGSDFAPLWSFTLNSITGVTIRLPSLSVAPDGGVFFGGTVNAALPGETYGGSADAVAGKITAAGVLGWVHQLGSSGSEATRVTLPSDGGAMIAVGESGGQLPGKPSTVAKGPWAARYESNGTRTFLEQYEPFQIFDSAGTNQAFADASGNTVVVATSAMMKLDSQDGSRLATITKAPLKNPLSNYPTSYLPLVVSPAQDAFYTWSPFYYGQVTQFNVALDTFSMAGALLSFREAEPPRTAVIDSVENVIWTGNWGPYGSPNKTITGASDAVYLTGTYTNSYMNGSIARPTTTRLFVGRYDLSGDRVWFQEFTFQPDTVATTLGSTLTGVVLDPDENLIILMRAPTTAVGGFIFKLKKTDGSLL